jgi:predicted nucleic acid-binding protein
MTVIADTSPINYLILIGQAELLRAIFGRVRIPAAVLAELRDEEAPPLVREWAANPPNWVSVHATSETPGRGPFDLHAGERAAIELSKALNAKLLVMDEIEGRLAARSMGLSVIGTLGVLEMADRRGLVDFRAALEALQRTTFHASPQLISQFLSRYQARRQNT